MSDSVAIPSAPAPVEPRVITSPLFQMAAPCYGKIDMPFTCSMIRSMRESPGFGDIQFFGGDSLVSRARNNLAQMFLDGAHQTAENGENVIRKFDWLFFVDTDLIFTVKEVNMLYDRALRGGPGIYAGTYPMKKLRPQVVCNHVPNAVMEADGSIAVREAGTGFMMIHRDVLTKMQAAYPENDFITDNGDMGGGQKLRHDWFQVGVKRDLQGQNPRYLSEDWFFCQKWADMGGITIMQTHICAQHIGVMTFPVNPAEIIEIADMYKKSAEMNKERKAKDIADAA